MRKQVITRAKVRFTTAPAHLKICSAKINASSGRAQKCPSVIIGQYPFIFFAGTWSLVPCATRHKWPRKKSTFRSFMTTFRNIFADSGISYFSLCRHIFLRVGIFTSRLHFCTLRSLNGVPEFTFWVSRHHIFLSFSSFAFTFSRQVWTFCPNPLELAYG